MALAVAAIASMSGVSAAEPQTGQALPAFAATDLLGRQRQSRELVGRPTLVVAITDANAGNAMQAWFDTAGTRAPAGVRRQSILALSLPFFVPSGLARGRARERVPREYWGDTWLGTNGSLRRTLGLRDSPQPYVFVLDGTGRVTASVHATAGSPAAATIWRALAQPAAAR
jgi:hypothetical protein